MDRTDTIAPWPACARGDARGSTRLAVLAGLAMLALGAALTLLFSDVTIHGPDQIRDVAVARRLVHDGIFPLNSPAFTDIYTMPPGVYYLIALPLLVVDREEAVFLAFGLLFLASQAWLWKVLLERYGAAAAALYAAGSTPFLSHLFVHSAWHNGLILTITSVYVGLLIRATSGSPRAWAGAVGALFLSAQISPSIGPLGVSFLASAWRHRAKAVNRWSLAAVALSLAAFAAWVAVTDHPFAAKSSGDTASHIRGRFVLDPARILDPGKWWDFFSFPARAADALLPMPYGLLVWGALLVTLAGLARACIARFARGADPSMRALVDALGIWLAIAAVTLPTGVFYYAYAIVPLVAVLSALGLHALLAGRGPRHAEIALAAALFAVGFGAHLRLYTILSERGVANLDTAQLTFPVLPEPASDVPFVSARTQLDLFRFLGARGICPDQVGGIAFLVMHDVSLRGLAPRCGDAPRPPEAYFLSHPLFNAPLAAGDAVVTVWEAAGYRLVAVPRSAGGGTDGTRTAATSTEKFNYSTFRPARWPDGVPVALGAAGRQLLRVSLRCEPRTLALDDASIRERLHLAGATLAGAPTVIRRDVLWHDYFELELAVDVAATPTTLRIGEGPLDCDVAAVATERVRP